MARDIVALIPEHRVYIEPFFGSGAVLLAKQPSVHEIVNDANDAVVAFFQCLRDCPDDLERVCALSPYARTELQLADLDEVPKYGTQADRLELARRFWVRVNMGFGGHGRRTTGFSRTMAGGPGNSKPIRRLNAIDRFGEVAARLAQVTIECTDAVDLIVKCAKTEDTVVYCDPPYLAETRNTSTAGDYVTEMTSPESHTRLAEALHATPATVLLSGYHSPLYDELYGTWCVWEFERTSHTARDRSSDSLKRVEVVWSNRPFGGFVDATPQLDVPPADVERTRAA